MNRILWGKEQTIDFDRQAITSCKYVTKILYWRYNFTYSQIKATLEIR